MTEPFTVAFPDAALEDLRTRILATRWPERETVSDDSQGVRLEDLRELCRYWVEEYDWRRCERALNAFPQLRTHVDGVGIHALHARSPEPDAVPLVLTHGWPGSVLEFLEVIGPLADPAAHGGDPRDAFHLVVPSLPGYGFSDRPSHRGWNIDRIADAWVSLMAELGYERFGAQGGDWGAFVTTALGRRHPDTVLGIHVNAPVAKRPVDPVELTEEERRRLARADEFNRTGNGYFVEQRTRPQTIGYALVDSPVALCAWIVEKLVDWTDGGPVAALSRDAMLDQVTLYWLTATGASAARLYWEAGQATENGPVTVPAGVSMFPAEIIQNPRAYVEEVYRDLRYWNDVPAGGHFAAWEEPALFVDELRAFFRLLR